MGRAEVNGVYDCQPGENPKSKDNTQKATDKRIARRGSDERTY